jgi:hypothetical protein
MERKSSSRVAKKWNKMSMVLEPPFVPEWISATDQDFPVKISVRAAKNLYWHIMNSGHPAVGLRFFVNDLGMHCVEYDDAARLNGDEYWISRFGRIPVAVRRDEIELFRGFMLDRRSIPPGAPNLFVFAMVEGLVAQANDPGRLLLSMDQLRKIHPELLANASVATRMLVPLLRLTANFGSQPKDASWISRYVGVHDPDGQSQVIESLASQIWYGDANPALVVSVQPLIVAAYSPDIDNVMLLRLPNELGDNKATNKPLRQGDRLVTCNTYQRSDEPSGDIPLGPEATGDWNDCWFVIANLISSDQARLDELTASFSDRAWHRCNQHAQRRLANGDRCRDGRPNFSWVPIAWQKSAAYRIRGGYLS